MSAAGLIRSAHTNRESAQLSRLRKKNHLEMLEGQVQALEAEKAALFQRMRQLTEENERLRAHGPSAVPNSLESESVIGLGELSGSTDLGGDAMVSALCAPAGTHAGSSSRCSSSSDSSGQDKAQSKSSVPPAAASPAQPKAEAGAGKRAQASSSTASRAGASTDVAEQKEKESAKDKAKVLPTRSTRGMHAAR
jgi:hypothetical protein